MPPCKRLPSYARCASSGQALQVKAPGPSDSSICILPGVDTSPAHTHDFLNPRKEVGEADAYADVSTRGFTLGQQPHDDACQDGLLCFAIRRLPPLLPTGSSVGDRHSHLRKAGKNQVTSHELSPLAGSPNEGKKVALGTPTSRTACVQQQPWPPACETGYGA